MRAGEVGEDGLGTREDGRAETVREMLGADVSCPEGPQVEYEYEAFRGVMEYVEYVFRL